MSGLVWATARHVAPSHARVKRKLDRFAFEAAVVADAGGWASAAESAALAADPLVWAATLRRLIHETDDGLRGAAGLTGDLRELVLADLTEERDRLSAVLVQLTGDEIESPALPMAPVAAVATRTPATGVSPDTATSPIASGVSGATTGAGAGATQPLP